MINKEVLKKTSNRKVFNRAYKQHLEKQSKIRCSYCKYHDSENSTSEWYGGRWNNDIDDYKIKHPSWKLVSKNRKQWMKKPIKFIYDTYVKNSGYIGSSIDINW